MPLVLLLLIGIVSSSAWAACEVTKETCLQGPETRIIGGEEIFRECWQWETFPNVSQAAPLIIVSR